MKSTRHGTWSSGATPSTTGTRLYRRTIWGDGMPWGSGTAFAGMSLDYMRFNSDGMLNNYKMERDAIRKYDKETPITTNLMGNVQRSRLLQVGKRNGYRILGQLPELQYTMEPRSYDPRPDARPQRRTVHADGADSEPAELAAITTP